MRKSPHHQYWYYLLGKLLQGFLVLTYLFFTGCLLLFVAGWADVGQMLLATGLPWLLRVGITFGCGLGILSLIEALS